MTTEDQGRIHPTRGLAGPDHPAAVPIDRLPAGGCGRIAEMEVAAADLQRLQVMGLCPGRWLQVVQPGDPMIVRVVGTRLALSAALATFVYVVPGDAC